MKPQQPDQNRTSLLALSAVTGGLVWVSLQLGSPMEGGDIRLLPAAVLGLAGLGGLQIVIRVFELSADAARWKRKHTPTGQGGTAAWAKKRDYKHELSGQKDSFFYGVSTDRNPVPLFFNIESNAACVAPAGAGKGKTSVVPAILNVLRAKVVPDLKGGLTCMTIAALEKRGETNIVLNPGRQFENILGPGDSYSPIDIVVDDLNRPGGLRDVMDDLREMTACMLKEPETGNSENSYFREGSRRIMGLAILIEAMVEEYDATLSSVALLIEDRIRLEQHARWIVGIDDDGNATPGERFALEQTEWAKKHSDEDVAEFAQLVRAQANNLLALMCTEDTRTFDSFITGAQQALAPFAFGRIAPAMGRSTFKMGDLKRRDKTVNLFVIGDSSRPKAFEPFIELTLWCCLTTLKRHENRDVPVCFLFDEATNYKISGLIDLLTYGREYKLVIKLWFQNFAAFTKAYSRESLDILLSEAEILQFLPGQREPKTLDYIEKRCGKQSVMSASMGGEGRQDTLSETGRSLMDSYEVNHTDKAITFVRDCKPILSIPLSYSQVEPWRSQAGINPFFGKPYLEDVKLRLKKEAE